MDNETVCISQTYTNIDSRRSENIANSINSYSESNNEQQNEINYLDRFDNDNKNPNALYDNVGETSDNFIYTKMKRLNKNPRERQVAGQILSDVLKPIANAFTNQVNKRTTNIISEENDYVNDSE